MRLTRVVTLAAVLTLALAAGASAGVTFQTMPGVYESVGITGDRQGNVYVVAAYFDTLKVRPDGTATHVPWPIPDAAWDAHLEAWNPVWGPDDKLWLTCHPLVCHIDPDAGTLIDTPPAYGTPGPDGDFWAVDGATGVVTRTTVAGVVTYFPGLPAAGGTPSTVVSGPGDSMWFTYGGSLVRVTMAGIVTAFPLPTDLQPGRQLTAGPDGNLWASIDKGVARISPAGQVLGRYSVTDTPSGLAPGPDGDVWFTYDRAGGVGRISPSGHVSDFAGEIGVFDLPVHIIRAADGSMWVNAFDEDKLWRIVPDPPSAVTEAPGGIGPSATTLNATVNPRGGPTSAYFEYGTTAAYGARTASRDAGDGEGGVLVSAPVDGLAPETTYHYRVAVVNGLRTVYGADRTLTTAPAPEPPAPPGVVEGASVDGDGDGYPVGVDCDDHAASVHPGAVDRPGDRVDQDCSAGPAPWGHLAPAVDAQWATHGRSTRFTRMALGALPAKATITLRCHGPGCALKTYKIKTKVATKHLNLLARLHGSRLRRGAIVELRLAAARQATTIIRWHIGPPTRRSTTCLAPRARKEAPCA